MLNHDRIAFEECFLKTQVGSPPTKSVSRSDILWEVDCVIPFNVKKQVAIELFYTWLRGLWFAPVNMEKNIQLHECRSIFLPYWLFEVEVFSMNQSEEGLSPSTIRRTSSNNLNPSSNANVIYQKYREIMVPATALGSRVTKPPLELLEPFKLDQLQPFTLHHTQENVDVRPFLITAEVAFEELAKQKIDKLQVGVFGFFFFFHHFLLPPLIWFLLKSA